ncbi:MAG TPA: SDR family oxidoreductase [Alphaproteobacteria bacterium]|nr:SDR family oxidoreductase [Alphaproteobacteria bacterium]
MPTVLITGAGRGLGFEFAKQYAADGWKVIATVREPAAGAKLSALGKTVEVHLADVTDRAAIARLAKDLRGAAIDVLICNAGIYGPKGQPFGQTDYAAWEQVMRVNAMAPMAVVEALVDNVAASAQKRIVMMSSGLGSIARNDGGDPIYRSSKTALNQVMRTLSAELKDRGITVVSVSPGWVKTDMGGSAAPLTADVSIMGLRKVIAGLSVKDTGRYVHYDGTENPW